jgi:prepilin-type N-terminal cleavage/methylation domain-containing protein
VKGFTLLEVALAIVVFATGTIAVMELLHRAEAGAADGENVLIATYLAQRRLEELRNSAYGNLANEAEARVTSPSGFSRFCRQVTVTTPYTNLAQIAVTVSWDPPDCTASPTNPNVSLSTYRSNI